MSVVARGRQLIGGCSVIVLICDQVNVNSQKLVYIDFDRSLIVSLKLIIIFIHLESVLLELKD